MPKPSNLTAAPMSDAIGALQTAVLELALLATAGSAVRQRLCEAASYFPNSEFTTDHVSDGGLQRNEVASLLRRINETRERGDVLAKSARSMRNVLESVLDLFDEVAP